MDSATRLDLAFRRRVIEQNVPRVAASPDMALPKGEAVSIFRAQCVSRHLDILSRKMQKSGEGFYTIGSSGHENMASVAKAVSRNDLAFLHYRDAAFQIMRAMDSSACTPIRDLLLSFSCSKEDPISGGRHKVLGSKELNISPQTSTIASHLPKAVGAAFSIGLPKSRIRCSNINDQPIVLCSFGDASSNHSTAQGAINTACWTSYKNLAMPILFVCEDNGIGISVPTPKHWIRQCFSNRPGLRYFHANGLDLYQTRKVAQDASEFVRDNRKPAFLHLSFVRLMGHAGSDMETAYLSEGEILANEENDPLLQSARLLMQHDELAPKDILGIYDNVAAQCQRVLEEVKSRPRLSSAEEVMQSIIPPVSDSGSEKAIDLIERKRIFGRESRYFSQPHSMVRLINWTLTDLMLEHQEVILFGQDVGKKGGVYGVTKRLQQRFGAGRVMDTLLDEQSILGLAIGMSQTGFLPIPEIQFLAYLHNAEDQLRGEAATLSFFSNGQFYNPMVVRVAGLGYQKGFGGHFHNDNSIAVMRDIPGLVVACPSNGRQAARILRECVRLARIERRVVVFLEPIALYSTRDLNIQNDNRWASIYPDTSCGLHFGEVSVGGDGRDLALISYGNGFYLSSQAADELRFKHSLDVRLIDLNWLSPLPISALLKALTDVKNILIVDECRTSGNIAEGLIAKLYPELRSPITVLSAEDSFIATGPAYAATMPSKRTIVKTALELMDCLK